LGRVVTRGKGKKGCFDRKKGKKKGRQEGGRRRIPEGKKGGKYWGGKKEKKKNFTLRPREPRGSKSGGGTKPTRNVRKRPRKVAWTLSGPGRGEGCQRGRVLLNFATGRDQSAGEECWSCITGKGMKNPPWERTWTRARLNTGSLGLQKKKKKRKRERSFLKEEGWVPPCPGSTKKGGMFNPVW